MTVWMISSSKPLEKSDCPLQLFLPHHPSLTQAKSKKNCDVSPVGVIIEMIIGQLFTLLDN
jgi:hypothetical protein